MTARVKALTLLGRHDEAKQVMLPLTDFTPGGSAVGPIANYWTGEKIHFTESWVYASAGEEAKADEARILVLANTRDYQYTANARLHEALCTVVNGGIDQGVRQAATVLDTLPPRHRSHMITETGRVVLRAVPLDQQQRPAVSEFQEVLRTLDTQRTPTHNG